MDKDVFSGRLEGIRLGHLGPLLFKGNLPFVATNVFPPGHVRGVDNDVCVTDYHTPPVLVPVGHSFNMLVELVRVDLICLDGALWCQALLGLGVRDSHHFGLHHVRP